MINFVDLWVYLSGSPLLWLTATLIAYLAADAISLPPVNATRLPIRFSSPSCSSR
jgi:hypothetical protein